ncbi:hypothetical protein [Natronococcus sp. A-GB7]|uniref:hypothetical protein n=1 Tax=Natronococcus sp. A-GB7 TaxID=3037649 RepID=UPI00241CE9B1|nr:hypothetical protein [Natronococcus sp. A-GB7]MDG5817994.1 hypothetical protein [Natronococcus sp. A-GB7]
MYGDSNPTRAFGSVHAVLIAVLALAIGGTFGLSYFGLSGGSIGAAFILIFASLLALGWPLLRKAQPRHDRNRE